MRCHNCNSSMTEETRGTACATCTTQLCMWCRLLTHWDGCPLDPARHLAEMAAIVAAIEGRSYLAPNEEDWAQAVAMFRRRTVFTDTDREEGTARMREEADRRRRQREVVLLLAEVFPDLFLEARPDLLAHLRADSHS